MKRALWAIALSILASGPAIAGGPGAWPTVSDEEAWKLLPPTLSGGGGRLPNWAKATARDLPKTTAAVLDLDRIHRTKSPLDPVLRAKMRWLAADANRCDYTRATAESDLRRLGLTDADLADLAAAGTRWSPDDREALSFAHQMTVDASVVGDSQFESLRSRFGNEHATAMVLLLAAANFQDRLILGLGVPLEDGGPLPPLEVVFDRQAEAPPVPVRDDPATLHGPEEPTRVDDPSWGDIPLETLQGKMTVQKERPGRVPVPTFETVLSRWPEWAPKPKAPIRIKWSLVCMGYQPELASAWSACTTAFRTEAKQDRVFEESQFWVVTRTISCFY